VVNQQTQNPHKNRKGAPGRPDKTPSKSPDAPVQNFESGKDGFRMARQDSKLKGEPVSRPVKLTEQ
jgi:hypothetical protein